MANTSYTEKLFSYGTLQQEKVQLAIFGRKLHGSPDIIIGYVVSSLQIRNPQVVTTSGIVNHPILIYTGNNKDTVNGTVFSVSLQELKQADEYEAAEYKRIKATLKSQQNAWVYVEA